MTETEAKYPFTLGFLTNKEKILMLRRANEPNKDLWNGVGGKIEEGESPEVSIIREVMEEVGVVVMQEQIQFGGIVSWDSVRKDSSRKSGMYVYVIPISEETVLWESNQISEGLLEWKDREWVLDRNNKEVVENIPHFLPSMLRGEEIICHFNYEEGILQGIQTNPIRGNN